MRETGSSSSVRNHFQPRETARFGPFEVDLAAGLLHKHGVRLKLHDQPFQVLAMLIARPGELITREEIQQKLWPAGTFVDFENGMNRAVNRLREALADSADQPKFIETIPRRGYRFVAPVELVKGNGTLVVGAKPEPQARRSKPWLWVAEASLVTAVFLLAAFGAWKHYHAPQKVMNFNARDWVLISSFENRTGEPVLEGTLEYALERELSNSQFVTVVSRERVDDVLRLMRKPLDTKIDATLGREICLRDGAIRALLTGRVEKLGTTYVLSAQLVDPVRGVAVASLSEEDPADSQLAAAVRRLSNRVRETLGEKTAQIQQSEKTLEKVTTPSLHALQLYTKADEFIRGGNDNAAAELLERALAEDPKFASGHLLLGYAYNNQGDEARARPHFRRAFELADSTSDRERFFILASYDDVFLEDDQKAAEAYEVLLRFYPDHYWGANNLLMSYVELDRLDEAAQLIVQQADLRPSNLRFNAEAVWAKATVQNDLRGARPFLERASTLLPRAEENPNPDSPDRRIASWMLLFPAFEDWLAGNVAQAHARLLQVEHTAKPLSPPNLASFHMIFGELSSAEKLCHEAGERREQLLAMVAFARGDLGAVKAHLRRAESEPGEHIGAGSTPSLLLIRVGLLGNAERVLRTDPYAKILAGAIALARGETSKGISALEQVLKSRRDSPWPAYFLASESLAQTYRRQGKADDALRVLRQASQIKPRTYPDPLNSALMNGAYWMRTELQLADLYREMGRVAEAETVEDELRKMLVYADADHPILRELQKRAVQ